MSVATTRAPAAASASALARPIPWAAAVTNAVLPCRSAAVVIYRTFPDGGVAPAHPSVGAQARESLAHVFHRELGTGEHGRGERAARQPLGYTRHRCLRQDDDIDVAEFIDHDFG